MRYLCGVTLLFFSAIAFDFAIRTMLDKKFGGKEDIAFVVTSIGSGLWCMGYGLMQLLENDSRFIFARGCGILGMLTFLMAAQLMLIYIGQLFKYKPLVYVEIVVSVIVAILVLPGSAVTLNHTEVGIVTAFNSSLVSFIYTAFTVIVAIIFIALTLKNRRSEKKRIAVFGHELLVVETLILIGMFFDTLFPALGINYNIPFSTMMQFVGLFMIYRALIKLNANKIILSNVVKYVYSTVKTPLLIFDNNNILKLSNDEAKRVFRLGSDEENEKIDFFKDVVQMEFSGDFKGSKDTVELDVDYYRDNRNYQFSIDPIYDDYDDYMGYIINVRDMTSFYDMMVETKDNTDDGFEELLELTDKALDDENLASKAADYLNELRDKVQKLMY